MFREEYNILDKLHDGVLALSVFVDLFPEFHLSFTYDHEQGTFIIIYDLRRFSLAQLKGKEESWLRGSYYTLTALNPDLEAIRRGVILINECKE